MWRKEKKDTSIFSLLLLLALATTPMAITLVVSNNLLHAQTSTSAEVTPTATPQKTSSGNDKFLFFADKKISVKQLTPILWLLLPLSALGGLSLWWLLGRRRSSQKGTERLISTPHDPIEEDSTQTKELSVAHYQTPTDSSLSSNEEFDTKTRQENLGPLVPNVDQSVSRQGEEENLYNISPLPPISVPASQLPQPNAVDVSKRGAGTTGMTSPLFLEIFDNRSDHKSLSSPRPGESGPRVSA